MARKVSKVKGVYWRKQGHDKDNRLFYSISEVAEMFDVEEHMLRTWEKHTPLRPKRSSSSGARMYTVEDLELVERLRYLIVEKSIQLPKVSNFIELDDLESELRMRDKLLEVREKVVGLKEMVEEQINNISSDSDEFL